MKEKIVLAHFVLHFQKKQTELSSRIRLKLIVTRGIRKAVERNRVKRVVREFFRQKRGLLRWDGVVCRVHPSAGGAKNAELFQELSKIL